jgi:hypothetical protein
MVCKLSLKLYHVLELCAGHQHSMTEAPPIIGFRDAQKSLGQEQESGKSTLGVELFVVPTQTSPALTGTNWYAQIVS